MLKKLMTSLTCLMCLIGCSSNTENLEKVRENQTAEKEETKTENKQEESKDQKKDDSYDNKDSSSSTSSEKQSSNNDQAVKSTSTQAKKTSQSSDNKTNNTSTVVKDQEISTSPPSSKTTKEPSVPATPTPTPEPVVPSVACLGGIDQNQTCDVILDQNYYFATFASESEAASQGQYYLDEVMYIGDVEITNYSVQPVYRNDHSIAYYGLNLWSNGILIQ